MLANGARIAIALVLACAASVAVIAAPLGGLLLIAAIASPPVAEDSRLIGAAIVGLAMAVSALVFLMILWLPALLLARRGEYRVREWAILLSPLSYVALVLVAEGGKVLAGGIARFDLSWLPVLVFLGPALMIASAFFFRMERWLSRERYASSP